METLSIPAIDNDTSLDVLSRVAARSDDIHSDKSMTKITLYTTAFPKSHQSDLLPLLSHYKKYITDHELKKDI